jgi:hypothetical protein
MPSRVAARRPEEGWPMLGRSRMKTRNIAASAVGLLAVVVATCVPMTASSASTAASPKFAAPTFAGSLVAMDDTATLAWGRDGGYTVPLPNGRTFWVFADSPRWQFQGGKWSLTGFVRGSSAGLQPFKTGTRPTSKFYEVVLGKKLAKGNKTTQLLANPHLFLPNGSGQACTKAAGGTVEAVRWATGAALMPDKANVLITYVDVCVTNAVKYTVQGWGFSFYNWKKNKLSVGPTDVFKPARSGAAMPMTRWYGSPIVVGNKVTLYTNTCCGFPLGSIYTTTLTASQAALRNPASYVSKAIPNLPTNLQVTVAPKSKTRSTFTMFQTSDLKGHYLALTSPTPTGPWTGKSLGQLPKCASTPLPCTSFAMHPEFSSKTKLVISYYLPGSGPNVGGHPDKAKHPNFGHIVYASIPM